VWFVEWIEIECGRCSFGFVVPTVQLRLGVQLTHVPLHLFDVFEQLLGRIHRVHFVRVFIQQPLVVRPHVTPVATYRFGRFFGHAVAAAALRLFPNHAQSGTVADIRRAHIQGSPGRGGNRRGDGRRILSAYLDHLSDNGLLILNDRFQFFDTFPHFHVLVREQVQSSPRVHHLVLQHVHSGRHLVDKLVERGLDGSLLVDANGSDAGGGRCREGGGDSGRGGHTGCGQPATAISVLFGFHVGRCLQRTAAKAYAYCRSVAGIGFACRSVYATNAPAAVTII